MYGGPDPVEEDAEERFCKICYGTDNGEGGEWMTPCKCSGSIKWVHKGCMMRWLNSAPGQQQTRCQMCRYDYVRTWHFKPFAEWRWPLFNLSTWDVVEIILDAYSTVKLVRSTAAVIEGKKSIITQLCYFLFWRTFILNDRRRQFYKRLGYFSLCSMLEPSIQNAL